mgnify:CR=1 FL=1
MISSKRIVSNLVDRGICHYKNKTNLSNIQRVKDILQIESDLHLEKKFDRKLKAKKPFLLLAGDIGYPFDKDYEDFISESSYFFNKVFVLSGNHEYDSLFYDKINGVRDTENKIKSICDKRNNVFYLQKDTHGSRYRRRGRNIERACR